MTVQPSLPLYVALCRICVAAVGYSRSGDDLAGVLGRNIVGGQIGKPGYDASETGAHAWLYLLFFSLLQSLSGEVTIYNPAGF